MRVYDLMTNRLHNPIGFSLDTPRLSYKVDQTAAKYQQAARIRIASDAEMRTLLYDSGKRTDIDSLCFVPDIELLPRTRYWWDVEVFADNNETARSAPAFFETGKMDEAWAGPWITAPLQGNIDLMHDFQLDKAVQSARIHIVGVGLYELYCNGEKVGDEMLAPLLPHTTSGFKFKLTT